MDYIENILIAFDQLINTILLGSPDETISSRLYRNRDVGFTKHGYVLVNKLFFWQDNHCKMAYESEILRLQQSAGFRRQLESMIQGLESKN
jgi:hypothetical protein